MISEPRKAEGSEPNRVGSRLTKQQKDATVQKWAEWILTQRKTAAEQKQTEEGTATHSASA
jgi:cytochrome c553